MPCEMIFLTVLPFIRKELAKCLISDHGFSQVKVAKKLGVSQPTISLYIARKRARIDISDEDVLKQVRSSAESISKGERSTVRTEICKLCSIMKEKGILGEIGQERPGMPLADGRCPRDDPLTRR